MWSRKQEHRRRAARGGCWSRRGGTIRTSRSLIRGDGPGRLGSTGVRVMGLCNKAKIDNYPRWPAIQEK